MIMHSFSPAVAQELGVECAILLQSIAYWVEHNEANETNLHDGKYWTYNTIAAWGKLFPYMSECVIGSRLRKLKADGYIEVGHFNENKYDKTNWYTVTELGYAMLNRGNHRASEPKTIDDTKIASSSYTVNTTVNTLIPPNPPTGGLTAPESEETKPAEKGSVQDDAVQQAFDTLWESYPRKQAKQDAIKAFVKLAPDKPLLDTINKALAWQRKSYEWQKERGMYVPLLASYLRGARWMDEPVKPNETAVKPLSTDSACARMDELLKKRREEAAKAVPPPPRKGELL